MPRQANIVGSFSRSPSPVYSTTPSAGDEEGPDVDIFFGEDPDIPESMQKTKIGLGHELLQNVKKGSKDKYQIVSIPEGAGGTFAFIKKKTNSHGHSWFENPPPGSFRTGVAHLGVPFIGTKTCATCVGVYFEIDGNRLFCAHINAWAGPRPTLTRRLKENSIQWNDIKSAVAGRLREHSESHGWTAVDVAKDTLLLVCCHPEPAGNAVIEGIKSFLGTADSHLHQEHGFIVLQGVKTTTGRLKFETLAMTKLEEIELLHDVPDEFEELSFIDPNPPFGEMFNYTMGTGWY